MLYGPKWEGDKQLGPISLRSFIAWLETKPADERYEYTSQQHCALGQFRAYLGFEGDDRYVDLETGNRCKDWQIVLKNIVMNNCDTDTWTFGGALERARAVLSSQKDPA